MVPTTAPTKKPNPGKGNQKAEAEVPVLSAVTGLVGWQAYAVAAAIGLLVLLAIVACIVVAVCASKKKHVKDKSWLVSEIDEVVGMIELEDTAAEAAAGVDFNEPTAQCRSCRIQFTQSGNFSGACSVPLNSSGRHTAL